MSGEEASEVGDFDPAEYQAELHERWGDTDAYRESARRTKGYTKDDWLAIKAEGAPIVAGLAAAMRVGPPPDDPAVMDLAEAHRLQIDKWFYPCSREMRRPAIHRLLGPVRAGAGGFRARRDRGEHGEGSVIRG